LLRLCLAARTCRPNRVRDRRDENSRDLHRRGRHGRCTRTELDPKTACSTYGSGADADSLGRSHRVDQPQCQSRPQTRDEHRRDLRPVPDRHGHGHVGRQLRWQDHSERRIRQVRGPGERRHKGSSGPLPRPTQVRSSTRRSSSTRMASSCRAAPGSRRVLPSEPARPAVALETTWKRPGATRERRWSSEPAETGLIWAIEPDRV
jgi:hypothetical protein